VGGRWVLATRDVRDPCLRKATGKPMDTLEPSIEDLEARINAGFKFNW
jgi:hypothetical protein